MFHEMRLKFVVSIIPNSSLQIKLENIKQYLEVSIIRNNLCLLYEGVASEK